MSSDALKVARINRQVELSKNLTRLALAVLGNPMVMVVGGYVVTEYLYHKTYEVRRDVVTDPNSPTGNVVRVQTAQVLSEAGMNDIKRIVAGSAFVSALGTVAGQVAGELLPGKGG